MESMLKFSPATIANMAAALEHVYRNIPPHLDSADNRKRIADAITASAENGKFSLSELKAAGSEIINDLLYPPRRSWLAKLLVAHRKPAPASTAEI